MKLHIADKLSLPRDTQTQTIVVYGGKGMGKTNVGSVLVEEMAKANLRFSVLDPIGVWWGIRHDASGKGKGVEALMLGGLHGDIPIEPTAGAVVADLVADEQVSTVIDISRRPNGQMWGTGEKIRFVRDYALRLFQRQGEKRRPLMQIVDECGRFAPEQPPKGAFEIMECVGAIEQLVELGRNVGVGVTLITQRSARMKKSVSELAECMIAFRTIGPNSVGAILDWFGEHVEKKRWNELVAQLRTLPRGTALVVSPGWLEFEGIATIRPRETFDSSATPTAGKERHATGQGAKPDLAKYQERMTETIERAKEADPKELKKKLAEKEKRITELEKQKAKPAIPTAGVPARDTKTERALLGTVKSLKTTVEEAMRFIININAQDFFAKAGDVADKDKMASAMKAAFDQALEGIDRKLDARRRDFEAWKAQGAKILRKLQKVVADENVEVNVNVRHNEPFTVSPPATPPVHRERLQREGAAASNSDLPIGERRVLAALIQYPEGLRRDQLTVLTGYKRSSRDTYLQRLRERGYVETPGDTAKATADGTGALPDAEPLPTGDALRDYWLGRLSGGEKAILEHLIGVYPAAVERAALDEATGYQRSSRDTYLQRLRARQLVVDTGRSEVRASETLFE